MKLDRSVIAGVDSNPRSAAIVHSIIRLCRNLGLQVTIEGVERPAQLDFLAACGEVSVQGFLIARPAEESTVIGLVRDTRGHLDALLAAAERERAATVDDDLTSSVRMLRRNRARQAVRLRRRLRLFGAAQRLAERGSRGLSQPIAQWRCAGDPDRRIT